MKTNVVEIEYRIPGLNDKIKKMSEQKKIK